MSVHPYNYDAQVFENQVVILDTSIASNTGGGLVVLGGFSAKDTYIEGQVAINNVNITPNLNDIVFEQQASLEHSQTVPVNITNFLFDNSVTSSFKATISVNVSANEPKYALWEINGVYKPTGWVITSSFSGDVTGVYFYINDNEGVGQVQYTNSNGIGTTTTIRYRATTTSPPGTSPTGSVGVINNTSGPFLANGLVYANTVSTIATSSELSYASSIFKIGGGGRIVAESGSEFTSFSNGGCFTAMGGASIAKDLIVATKIGVATTSPAFNLDIGGDINFTGTLYKSGQVYSSSTWGTDGENTFFTAGNVGIGTTSPSYKLHVTGDIFATGNVTAFSDARLKTNIQPLRNCLSKIQNFCGVSFTKIKHELNNEVDTSKQYIGFIAQEVETQFPELVSTDPQNGYKSLSYGNFTAVLVECLKDLKSEIDVLKDRIHDLENQ